jgi:putative endonuclease
MGYVYILTNDNRNVLYVGCTNDLKKRIHHHKHRLVAGFTKKYNVHQLVYFEALPDIETARRRERTLKGITRVRKDALIKAFNPTWRDLYGDVAAGTAEEP